jgi:hypothetical protein
MATVRQTGIDLRQVICAADEHNITQRELEDFFSGFEMLCDFRGFTYGGSFGLCDVNAEEDDLLRRVLVRVAAAYKAMQDTRFDIVMGELESIQREAMKGGP